MDHGKGFDRSGSISAYLTAKKLEPDNTATRENLALLYEYDSDGDRYTTGADLTSAIREYRELKDVDKQEFIRFQDNLLYALLYNREYKELLTELGSLPGSPTRDALGVSATAASQTPAAGMQRAGRISGDAQQRMAAMRLAGIQLMRLGLYAAAADMLDASIQGQADAAQVARQVEIFRSLKHANLDAPDLREPRGPVLMMLTSMMSGTLSATVPDFMDRHAFATEVEWKKNIEHNNIDIIHTIAAQAQMPPAVMGDIVLGYAKITSTGDDTHGYRVTMQAIGSGDQNLFVSRDEGKCKIIAASTDSAEVGTYALYLLDHNRKMEARSLLDWKREFVHRGGGDDPLDGNLFARFWASSQEAKVEDPSPASFQIAALALTIQKPDSQVSLDAALAAWNKAPDDVDLTLLLASAYSNHHDAANALPYLNRLLAKYPNSLTAITMLGAEYSETRDYKAWRAMLDARLADRPADHDLLVQSAREAAAESDCARVRALYQRVIDSGKATSNDYNALGWIGLFDNHADAKSIEAAQQANSISKSSNFGDIHTLACLYAAAGKTSEARELLLKAMAANLQAEPNEEVWFGFGSIYEQYGMDDAAITAYQRVYRPEHPELQPTATYNLAQARIAALQAK